MSDLSLQIAASGIEADQAELDTAANNLSNVSTPGYVEEVVNLKNITPSTTTGVGEGVAVQSVTEDGSALYDQLNLVSQGQLGSANEAASVQNLTQNAFPEPSSTGIQAQLSQLWTDLSTLATQPSSSGAQESVVQDANQVSQSLNGAWSQLSDVGQQLSNDLEGQGTTNGGYIGQANQLINQIATLNGDIVAGQNGGTDVNSLVDQRREAVNQLGTLLGVRTTTEPDGTMTVTSGGIQLVSSTNAVDLQATGTAASGDLGVETTTGNVLSTGGQIGALLTGVNTTIPDYQSQLSSIADSLAQSLNTLQSNGVSASGVPGATSSAGAPPYAGSYLPSIFVNNGSSTTYTPGSGSAQSITVNPTLMANPSLIATASGTSTAGTATIDPTTAQAMAAVGQASGGPDDLYQSLVALVGAQTSAANNNQTSAQALSDSTTAQLSSVEGVDTNQETVNMLSAQQAYQATAAVINSTTTALEALLAAV
ncbi:MAG: flagellar hook-associated protein FlgK [Acidimicrobiales bacterium]|jgi:flagellar hook-associated protein 1 FlgK